MGMAVISVASIHIPLRHTGPHIIMPQAEAMGAGSIAHPPLPRLSIAASPGIRRPEVPAFSYIVNSVPCTAMVTGAAFIAQILRQTSRTRPSVTIRHRDRGPVVTYIRQMVLLVLLIKEMATVMAEG